VVDGNIALDAVREAVHAVTICASQLGDRVLSSHRRTAGWEMLRTDGW
jgi:hypothetical protein